MEATEIAGATVRQRDGSIPSGIRAPGTATRLVFVSVTRLHVRHWRFFPPFALYSFRSTRQARNSAGFLGGQLAPEPLLGFWTITVWTDESAMRRFRNHAAHLEAMPHLLDWCDEASYVHWQQDNSALPTLEEVFQRVGDGGKLSKVSFPSVGHKAGRTVSNARPRPGSLMRPHRG